MARLISVMGRLTGDDDSAAALQLVFQIGAFAENLADLRRPQQRLHQVRNARLAATILRGIASRTPSAPRRRHRRFPFSTAPPRKECDRAAHRSHDQLDAAAHLLRTRSAQSFCR